MTRRYIINELIKPEFRSDCNHCLLEGMDVTNE